MKDIIFDNPRISQAMQMQAMRDLAYLHYLLVTTPAENSAEILERSRLLDDIMVLLETRAWESPNQLSHLFWSQCQPYGTLSPRTLSLVMQAHSGLGALWTVEASRPGSPMHKDWASPYPTDIMVNNAVTTFYHPSPSAC